MTEQSEKAIKSIGRSIANINKQIEILRNEYPEAQMYIEDGSNYNIMPGSSHEQAIDGRGFNTGGLVRTEGGPLATFIVIHSECGAW